MHLKSLVYVGVFSCVSSMAFAVGGVYTTVTGLEGNAVVGQETTFKVKYKWLTDQDRSGKIFYKVAGTNCNGSADIDRHSGLVPVSGELEIKCTFEKSAVFQSDTVLQLYDGATSKETSEHKTGKITVTNQ